MGECVTVSEKKEFIQWFLSCYELQKREAAWLLNYLCSEDQLLKRTHFVNSLCHLPKTLLISTRCIRMTPFKFMKNQRVSADVESAFYDLRTNKTEDLYVSLCFKDQATCPEYAAVLEGNPMERQDLVQDILFGLMAEMILDESVREFRKKDLYQRIDEALEAGDEEQFLQLTEQWLKIVEKER
ncbi:ReoY family proteolytic degradation factor [Kroppenstedtia sanguinis]|uniref:ReoY family proteolytic degradation factor n=1 Tax=Kroppenstedtia sanguinis TaxID=1380684 RepID=A0ABW4C8M7_9BACL